ncbi:MAG: chemotaxis protein CheW [Nibricoccus sp.]
METLIAPNENNQLTGKYLTVCLGGESYALAVLKVREIIRMQKITPVPQVDMPPFVKGVINLRGRVVPVVDLRLKFGLPGDIADRTCIVVVQVRSATTQFLQIGLIVDRVEEVLTINDSDIEPTPDFGTQIETKYLLGMAKVKGEVKTLLDLDRVIAP